MSQRPIVVWLRNDLRLTDNQSLIAAEGTGAPVVPLFVWSPSDEGDWRAGAASKWWLHHSLEELGRSFEKVGSRLIIRSGGASHALAEIVRETGAQSVHLNRRCEPWARTQENDVLQTLKKFGVETKAFNSSLLADPDQLRSASGKAFQIFTPYCKRLLTCGPTKPDAAPRSLKAPDAFPASLAVADLNLMPKVFWYQGIAKSWSPGESGAHRQLALFLDSSITHYEHERDRPDRDGVSRLSPYLHFGEISPNMVRHEIEKRVGDFPDTENCVMTSGSSVFIRQLIWREFAHYMLYHFPETTNAPFRKEFAKFPWHADCQLLEAWQKGATGYPIVDAGMRELWTTGWMHNRVRMIVASFLTKHLMLPWQDGAKWFWDTLVDADLSNNTMGWQWVAGCGSDAAPYFRIFNPVLQGMKFDPEGNYVRKWVPELQGVSDKYIHRPWQDAARTTRNEGDQYECYPRPLVNHDFARRRALAAFEEMKSSKTATA